MSTEKVKFALRMEPKMQEQIKTLYKTDNCRSQNEFIEKAIQFYMGYLFTSQATDYISEVLLSQVEGIVQYSEGRIRLNLFKMATEVGLNTRVISTYEGIESLNLSKLRGNVVYDLKRTNGLLKLEDAVGNRSAYFEIAHGEGGAHEHD